MRLPALDRVLFDEFPSNETVKYCFFTQPKIPHHDYSEYSNRVIYCATESTLSMMLTFKKLSVRRFHVLSERKLLLSNRSTQFSVRAIPTGNVSGSVMFLIKIGEAIHFYTGQFNECRPILLSTITHHYRNQIHDIYVDNTMAALKSPDLLHRACNEIRNVISAYPNYKIYLHVEVFGYEELLFQLARSNIKIRLHDLQMILFKKCGHDALFRFNGQPQLKVYALVQGEKAIEEGDYKLMFERHQIIHIRLVVSQHTPRQPSKIKGLIYIPYTPHAGAHELYSLFQVVQPKRVHPLVKQSYSNDPLTVIPESVLNVGCEIVDFELNVSLHNESSPTNINRSSVKSNGSFLDSSSLSNEDILLNVSDIVFDPESDESHNSENEHEKSNVTEETKHNSNIQPSLANTSNQMDNKIISLDGEEEDDIFRSAMPSSSGEKNPSNSMLNQSMRRETDKNVIMRIDIETQQSEPTSFTIYEAPGELPTTDPVEILTEKSPAQNQTHRKQLSPQKPHIELPSQKTAASKTLLEESPHKPSPAIAKSLKHQETASIAPKRSDANNNGEHSPNVAKHSKAVHQNETSTIGNKEKKKKVPSNIRQMGGIKRKTSSPKRLFRMQRVEYLTDSDEESEQSDHNRNIHQSKLHKKSESAVQHKLPDTNKSKIASDSNNAKRQRPQTKEQIISNTLEINVQMKGFSGIQNDASVGARSIRSVPDAERKNEQNLRVNGGNESDSSSSSDGCVIFASTQPTNVGIENTINKRCNIITNNMVIADSTTKYQNQDPHHDVDSESSSSDGCIVFPD